MDVEDGLFEPAGEDVPSETDNVLGPDERTYCVVHLCPQKVGVFARARHGELVKPGEVYTTAISEPIRRECWNCWIGDGGDDNAGLAKEEKHYVRSVQRSVTVAHIGSNFRPHQLMEEDVFRGRKNLLEIITNGTRVLRAFNTWGVASSSSVCHCGG